MNYYQTIPQLGIEGRMNTPEEFDKIGLPKDLTRKTVLDIGCNMGAFMLECLQRKARWVAGIEPNLLWRLLLHGVMTEQEWRLHDEYTIGESIVGVKHKFDLVLLLSITHIVEGMTGQEILDKAWGRVRDGGLLILEINDRLQKEKLKLPEGAKRHGTNKDNRTVYHCYKQAKDNG